MASSFDVDSVQKAKDCLRELAAKGVDPTQYTTDAWVADLDAVRAALGYPRVNLWGGSYGTRVALAYLRRHPDRVRSMVLDGVAPARGWWCRATSGRRASRRCTRCSPRAPPVAAVPRAAPRPRGARWRRLERELAAPGREVDVRRSAHGSSAPRRGSPSTRCSARCTAWPTRRNARRCIPEIVARASAGDFGPLFAAAQSALGEIGEQLTPALHYAVICSEDAPRITDADRAALGRPAKPRARAQHARRVRDLAARHRSPADFRAPVRSDVPVLLLSGGLDPVTPPAAADAVAATLPNSRHVVAPGLGHIVSRAVVRAADDRRLRRRRRAPRRCPPPASSIPRRHERRPLWPDRLGPQP